MPAAAEHCAAGPPVGAQQGLDQGVRSLLCATARRTDKSYDSAGCWKDEPLGAQPLTSEAKENLQSIVLKGPFDKPSFKFFQVGVTIATVQNPTLRVVAWCP